MLSSNSRKIVIFRKLITEIVKYIEVNSSNKNSMQILESIKRIELNEKNKNVEHSKNLLKSQSLKYALSTIVSNDLLGIKNSILSAVGQLYWSVDNGDFYEKNSGVGTGYLNGNMNTELIGPEKGFFRSDELRLGLFFLESDTFYADHMHAAPELYLTLTNSTKWRFGKKAWKQKPAGSVIYNEPFKPHAMVVGSIPFLSVWCWPNNSNEKCVLISGIKE